MKQTLILFMQDEPGVLNRISSLVRRRNFNIESIVAGRTEKEGITRMTLVVNEPDIAKRNSAFKATATGAQSDEDTAKHFGLLLATQHMSPSFFKQNPSAFLHGYV